MLPYEARNTGRDFYDPRTLVRNPVLPHQVIPSAYSSRNGTGKIERPVGETRRDFPSNAKQLPNCGMAAKLAPDIAIDIDSNPYYTSRGGGTKLDRHDDRVVIDTSLLQAKAQYGGLGAGAAGATKVAAHRKVAMMQYSVARMY